MIPSPYTVLVSSLVLLSLSVSVANSSTESEECGSAKVISGDTCSNVKVQFEFAGCPGASGPQLAKRIICDKTSIKARYQDDANRYEARFKKVDDGWGGVTWTITSPVRRFAKNDNPAPAPKSAPVVSTPPAPAQPPVGSVEEAPRSIAAEVVDAITVSSFFDFRHSQFRKEGATRPEENEKSGYLLEDGAVYFKFKKDKLEALVDLPFHRDAGTGTDNANFQFAATKAQAYGTYEILESLKFTFGQFDTIYGFELNDSKDRLFGNAGLVYAQTLPIVHSGAMLQFSHSGFVAKLLSANPADRDSLGSTTNDQNLESGIALGYSYEMVRGQVGHLTRAQNGLDDEGAQRSLTDILLGVTLGPVDLDAQYSIVKNPQKNTLTASTTDSEKAGSGLMFIAAYKPLDSLKVAARYEMLENDPGGTGYYKAQSLSGVLHYLVHENLTARLEWMDINTERRAAFATDLRGENRMDIGAIVSF